MGRQNGDVRAETKIYVIVCGLLLLDLPCSGSVSTPGPVVDPVHHFGFVPQGSAAFLVDRFRCLAAVCVGVEGPQRDDGPGFLLDQGDAFFSAEQDRVFHGCPSVECVHVCRRARSRHQRLHPQFVNSAGVGVTVLSSEQQVLRGQVRPT